jgi:5-formaminoimidazole-4-carboxamide-1-beta-D-ribofuranosyl 5'-monophosphate synthetase
MATTIINSQKVENFAKWKQGFEAGNAMREQAGIKIKGVYQSVDDGNSVTVISEVPNADMAKAIFSASTMKEAMEKSGVITTEIKILNQTF